MGAEIPPCGFGVTFTFSPTAIFLPTVVFSHSTLPKDILLFSSATEFTPITAPDISAPRKAADLLSIILPRTNAFSPIKQPSPTTVYGPKSAPSEISVFSPINTGGVILYLPQGSSLFEYMPSHISDRGNTVFPSSISRVHFKYDNTVFIPRL